MRRTSLNEGWEVRPKVHRLVEMTGGSAPWVAVTLPHDALLPTPRSPEAGAATGYYPGGEWQYRRPLDLDALGLGDRDPGGPVLVELEGAYRSAVVTVNGSVAARRPNGYSGFHVAIDHLLGTGGGSGGDVVEVDVASGNDSRWYAGAGLYRDVWLLTAGPRHLAPATLVVRTPDADEGGATVTVDVDVVDRTGTTSTVMVVTRLVDGEGRVVAEERSPVTLLAGTTVGVHQRLHVADPDRWGPDDPHLHTATVTLLAGDEELDAESTTFGIRTLTLDPRRGLRVNGERVDLRGACVHHDNGPIGAATIARAEERRVELLKAAGFNALRSSHHPMSRALLDACDRHGVLVMDELTDMWAQPKTGDDYARDFEDWWGADLAAMVAKDTNHPSVVLYSIGNEIADGSTATGIQRGRALAARLRALDPTRFVTQAVSGLMVAGPAGVDAIRAVAAERAVGDDTGVNTAIMNLADLMNLAMATDTIDAATEEAFSHLDVAGYNYMESRLAIDGQLHPNRVIVASETHPAAIAAGWPAVTDHPNVIGDFTWTGWNYLGEAGIGRLVHQGPDDEGSGALGMLAFHGPYPWLVAGCGDLDITGGRRPQSYFREIVFGLRTDPYLAVERPEHHGRPVAHSSPWSWPDVLGSWSFPGHEGELAVDVYAAAPEVELVVNGRSLGRRPAGRDHGFTARFDVPYEPGRLEAVAWDGATEVGRAALDSAGEAVRLQAEADRGTIAADTADLAFVAVALVDDGGVVHVTHDRPVTVTVEGPGVLQGLGTGRPDPTEPYTGPTVTTHDGRALAVVRPTGPGTIRVTVTADGCDPVAVEVEAEAEAEAEETVTGGA